MTRGLAYWTDGKERAPVLHRRPRSPPLHRCADGQTGPEVRRATAASISRRGLVGAFNARIYSLDSPPLVVADLVIVGSNMPENVSGMDMPPGHVRAFDVRTGQDEMDLPHDSAARRVRQRDVGEGFLGDDGRRERVDD